MADRLHALAFNELTAALSMYSRFVPLSEREEITRRVVRVVQGEHGADLANALRRADVAETEAENANLALDELRGEMQELEAELRRLKQRQEAPNGR